MEDVERRLFAPSVGGERVGVEVELIPVEASTGKVLPIAGQGCSSTLGLLELHGQPLGWRPAGTAAGSPTFLVPEGGILSFEPGGQLEYSTPALTSADGILALLEAVIDPLVRRGRDEGVAFVARGLDPWNPVAGATRHLTSPRYARMEAHYGRRGPWGRRMMCQSAAIHVNLDFGEAPLERWVAANAAVPVWTATFANSRQMEGRASGHRSARAEQWRHLDPGRSGIPRGAADPASVYVDFALGADAFLVGEENGPAEPLATWLERGCVDRATWELHLTTLFPEVRPRGYLEIRPFDALGPAWYVAPIVLAMGLLYNRQALRGAIDLLPPPTPEALAQAGRVGLKDPRLAGLASELATLSLEGAERLGGRVGGRSLEVARAFVSEFTSRGRDPGDSEEDLA